MNLEEKAALLGVSCREIVRLGNEDARVFGDAALATPAAVRRLRAWLAAGMPVVAADEIMFHGNDAVRSILIATIASFPAPFRWLATRYVSWFGIGRGPAAAYMTTITAPALADDTPQVIVIDERTPDASMPSMIAHEMGHALHRSWRAPVNEHAELTTISEAEYDARVLAAMENDRDAAARLMFRSEHLANECARLFGYAPDGYWCPDALRLQRFRERFDVAADRAADISRVVDEQMAIQAAANERETP